uniref:G-protein coupled receptors family 1 profile domain-containing protein n=1 Tax=Astyanax mexicanus TaxID=7994 RepID=A0A3B1KIX0_ASTMX
MDYFDNDTEFFHCTVKVDYNSRRIGLFLLHLLVFMVGLVMNVTVVWVNWQRRHSRNTVLFCQLNMGLADTMIMIMLPIYMLEVVLDHVWLWGDFLCRFSNLVVVLSIYASCFFLAYMSVERYLAVVRGSAPKAQILGMTEKRKRNIICAALWLVALFLAALETAHVRILHLQDPGSVVATANILWQLGQYGRALRSRPAALVMCGSCTYTRLSFVVCWLPYHLVMMLMMIDILKPSLFDCNMLEQLFFAYTVVRTTALLHCLANPLLYCFLSRSFRSKLISLVLRHLPQDAGNAGENSTSQSEAYRTLCSSIITDCSPSVLFLCILYYYPPLTLFFNGQNPTGPPPKEQLFLGCGTFSTLQ